MKISVVDEHIFRPVKFQITVETEDDLRELWHRFNITSSCIAAEYYAVFPEARRFFLASTVWDQINEYILERKILPSGSPEGK